MNIRTPSHDRTRLHERQGVVPIRSRPGESHPEQQVDRTKPRVKACSMGLATDMRSVPEPRQARLAGEPLLDRLCCMQTGAIDDDRDASNPIEVRSNRACAPGLHKRRCISRDSTLFLEDMQESCSRGFMAPLQQSQIGGSGDRTQKPVADEACQSVAYWYSL